MGIRLVFALGLVTLFPNLSPAQITASRDNDWLIVPGVRAGPITPTTTRADLVRMFGARNVLDDEVSVSDAGAEPGTVLYKEHPADSVIIFWAEGKSGHRIDSLVFCIPQQPDAPIQKTCHWRARENIGFGTTLKQLEKLNGRAFHLLGFAWDEEGYITSWAGGSLQTKAASPCGTLKLNAVPDFGEHPSAAQIALEDQVQGDKSFSSSIQAMQTLNPQVDRMRMQFSDCVPPKGNGNSGNLKK